jgi:hypothetical protein
MPADFSTERAIGSPHPLLNIDLTMLSNGGGGWRSLPVSAAPFKVAAMQGRVYYIVFSSIGQEVCL